MSWRHNELEENTSQLLQHQSSGNQAHCLAGTQQHTRAQLHGMLISAPEQQELHSLTQEHAWPLLLFPSIGDPSPDT